MLLGSAHEIWFKSSNSWTVEKEKPTVQQMHNFSDTVYRMAGRIGEG